MRVWVLVAVLLHGVASAHPAASAPKVDARQTEALKAFARGRYDDAAAIFIELYAETLHPNYLRNIARCYQNLERPDDAIKTFREYLRQGKNITPAEREEVLGFIQEMEVLKRRKEEAREHPPAAAVAPLVARKEDPPPAQPRVASANPVPAKPAPPPTVELLTQPPPAPPAVEAPVYKRWWFWGLVAGAAVAVTAGVLAATLGRRSDPGCRPELDVCGQAQ